MISNYNLYSLSRIIDQPRNEARLAWRRKRNGKHLRIGKYFNISPISIPRFKFKTRPSLLPPPPRHVGFHFIYVVPSRARWHRLSPFQRLLLYSTRDKDTELWLCNPPLIHVDVQHSPQGSVVIPEMAVVSRYSYLERTIHLSERKQPFVSRHRAESPGEDKIARVSRIRVSLFYTS